MVTTVELKNRIKQYRERAVELENDAPDALSEDSEGRHARRCRRLRVHGRFAGEVPKY